MAILLSLIVSVLNPFIISVSAITQNQSETVQWNYKCDINYDLQVDILDMSEISSKYNTTSGSANWIPKYDINNDRVIDLYDLVLVSKSLGSSVNPLEFVSAKEIESRIDDKMKMEFLYVINTDKELLDYYNSSELYQQLQMKIDISNLTSNQINGLTDIFSTKGILSTLSNLNSQLQAMGMPVALRYAFVAGGAGIMSAIVDGPLPIGDIIAIIIGVGVGAVIWYHWDFIEENSDKILAILKNVYYQVSYQIEAYFDDTLLTLKAYLSDVNDSSIVLSTSEEAVDSAGKDSEKINHIMEPKHDWNKFFKDPKWKDIAPLLIKALDEGKEQLVHNNVYITTLLYRGEVIVVRYAKIIKMGVEIIRIGTAFVQKN